MQTTATFEFSSAMRALWAKISLSMVAGSILSSGESSNKNSLIFSNELNRVAQFYDYKNKVIVWKLSVVPYQSTSQLKISSHFLSYSFGNLASKSEDMIIFFDNCYLIIKLRYSLWPFRRLFKA